MRITKVAARIAFWFRCGRRCRLNAAMRLLSTRRRRFDRKAGHSGYNGLGDDHPAEHSEDANDRVVDVPHRMIPKKLGKTRARRVPFLAVLCQVSVAEPIRILPTDNFRCGMVAFLPWWSNPGNNWRRIQAGDRRPHVLILRHNRVVAS